MIIKTCEGDPSTGQSNTTIARRNVSSMAPILRKLAGGAMAGRRKRLKRDDFSLNRHPALASCLSMIFSENRCTLFGIML
jgi:hypothetical protein